MKIGNIVRNNKKKKEDNKRRVQSVKTARQDEQMSFPLKTKVYGGLQFDMDMSTQRSSAQGVGPHFMSKMSNNVDMNNMKRGQSFIDHANFSTQPHSGIKSLETSHMLSGRQRSVVLSATRNAQQLGQPRVNHHNSV